MPSEKLQYVFQRLLGILAAYSHLDTYRMAKVAAISIKLVRTWHPLHVRPEVRSW